MEDIDYGELFGIDMSGAGTAASETAADAGAAEKPGSETEDAGNAEKSTEAGAQSAAGDEAQSAESPEAEEAEGADREQEGKKPQSPEENARFAAARRKAERERDEAIAAAQAQAQKEIDEIFKNSGMVNPYTKKPITSKAEYDEYRAKYDEEQRSKVQRKSGLSSEEFDQFVENLPQVRQARQEAEAARQAQQAAREQEAKARVEEQIREIHAMDPTINEIADLPKMENYEQFYELVRRGNTLTDAYKLVNYDRLVSQSAAAGRQQALNTAAGKAHMGRTAGRGKGAVAVPADVMEQYRMFNPGISDAEIQAHYNKYHKN